MNATATKTLYIASGQKNGFYTLRERIVNPGVPYPSDYYIRNLSTDPKKAEEKAQKWFSHYCKEAGWVFAGNADFDLDEWGHHKDSRLVQVQRDIENGIWPFGKFVGIPFEEAEDGYIKWWADRSLEAADETIVALIKRCKGIADERGLFDAELAEAAIKANSVYIGEIGDRLTFTAKLIFTKSFETQFGTSYIYNFRTPEENSVVYFGTADFDGVEKGESVTFSAKIKDHKEYKDEKQTIVARPTKCKRIEK